jgi:hypothetical protein
MIDCNIIMENKKIRELTGVESLILVPFSFDIDVIIAYRQSVDDEGNTEDYTVIYTDSGETWCIDIPYSELNKIYKNYKNDDKVI